MASIDRKDTGKIQERYRKDTGRLGVTDDVRSQSQIERHFQNTPLAVP